MAKVIRVTKEKVDLFLNNLTPQIKERVFARGVRAYLAALANRLKDEFDDAAVVKLATEGLAGWGSERKAGSMKLSKTVNNMIQSVCFKRVMNGQITADGIIHLRDTLVDSIMAELRANPDQPSPTIQSLMTELNIKPRKVKESSTEEVAA